jgi:hypothetical protein
MIPAGEMYLRMVLNSALDIPEGKEHFFNHTRTSQRLT